MADTRDRFLDRWARRKRAGQDGGQVAQPPTAAPEAGDPKAPDEAETAAIVESLPDIETLDESADFTAFLRDGVPEALRRRALRKLWRLNPVFANLDGLNDYDEDFTLATSALTQVKTIYQVGKGMVAKDEPPQDEPLQDEAAEAEVEAGDSAESGESQDGPEPDDEAVPPESVAETSAEKSLAEAQVPPAGPATAAMADAEPVKSGSAAERRWGRFKG